jgi:hypothetical protein
MATKAPLGSLSAEGPEEQALVDEIKGTYAKLRESLEARQNPLFDPVLLAMAQGFLAPTKTGSFGEALGNVAAQVGPAQEAQDKRAQEVANMKMELAQRELAQRQATRGEAMFREMLPRAGGQPGAATPGAPATPGTPAAPGAPATQQMRPITSADIARLASQPGMEGRAKILSDMIKSDRERFSISMNGIVFDKDTQQYLNLEIPGQKQEPFDTRYGRFNMTPYEYSQYKQAESAGKGKEWIDNFRGVTPAPSAAPSGAPAAPGAAPAAPSAKPSVRPTVGEQAALDKAAMVKAEKGAESEVQRTQNIIEQGSDVTGRLASIATLRSIASRPDSKQIFGILNRPDVSSAILNLIQEGIKSPGQSSIQVGALEDSLRNIGLPQDQIDRYRFALSTMANIQLQQAKLAAGQGSVSNFERELFASASISPKDTPGTILAKVSMLEARANFDRKRAAALRRSKMDADEFADTPDAQRMVNEYLAEVTNIASNIGVRQTPAATQRPATGNYGPAVDLLREELKRKPRVP